VRLLLAGAPNRAKARFCMWLALVLAFACIPIALWRPPWGAATLVLFFGALLYDVAIRWVDRHNAWP
jgi:hypothetical protein